MIFEDPTVIDSNGQKYLVGWDIHGWFSIMPVEMYPVSVGLNAEGEDTVTHEGEEYLFDQVGNHLVSLPPAGAKALIGLIEEEL